MAFFSTVKKYGYYGCIIEDPDVSKNRIFIENQAFNVDTLAPIPGVTFEFQNAAMQISSLPAASMVENPIIITQGKYGMSWSNTRQYWLGGIGRTDPWLLALDYSQTVSRTFRVPTRSGWEEEKEYTVFQYPRDITTNDLRNDVWIGDDLADGATFTVATNSVNITPMKVKEDGMILCITQDNDASGVTYLTSGESSMTITNIRNTANISTFYIGEGPDDSGDSGSYFVEVHNGTATYNIYKYGSRGNVSATLGTITGAVTNIIAQFPSNLKDVETDREVFYSSHFNASSVLTPRRIVWHKKSGEFMISDCTMTYPGANTYGTYASAPAYLLANYSPNTSNNYWMKPHVFKKNGTWYITFCTLEKCIATYPAERWNTSLSRGWVTYSIGSGTDDNQLTFHSVYTWPSAATFPRSWVPTTPAGDVMFIAQTGTVCTLTFDTTTGWGVSNSLNYDARAYGQDSTGRLYFIARGAGDTLSATNTGVTVENYATTGYNTLHVYDTNINAAEVSISYDSGNHVYTNANINANCYVSAFSDRVEVSATFGVRAAQEATITTSVAHNLSVGDIVDVNVSNVIFTSSNVQVTAVPTATTFKYKNNGAEQTSLAITGSVKKKGPRVARDLTLRIAGDSMVFANNSSSTIVITTSTSGDVEVPLVITSAGKSYVTVTKAT